MAGKKGRKVEISATLVTEDIIPCAICGREVDDEVLYGKIYAIGDIQCHYFCVLLSCCLVQKGRETDGLFGFLYRDILAEIERAKKHKCSYCSRGGATLGCSVSQCRKQFHLPCGREKNAVSLFYGNYKSYCQQHVPKQKVHDNVMESIKQRRKNKIKSKKGGADVFEHEESSSESEFVCLICYEEVEPYPGVQTFWPPCCARDAWFHRRCLQRMALTAGVHYLKCPLCNDKERFHEAVISQGYYIPDQDAAWELERNAYAEIYERNLRCDAEVCECPQGRDHDSNEGEWDLQPCLLCGWSGRHARCGPAPPVCASCRPAAPADLTRLTAQLRHVMLAEESRNRSETRRRPVMPSRMSLRRTKTDPKNVPSTSNAENKQEVTRQDLNLKPPRKPQYCLIKPTVLKNIEQNLLSPIKLLEKGVQEKINSEEIDNVIIDEKILEEVREKFRKPKPLCVKRKIVDEILQGLFDTVLKESKQKEIIKKWCSPKKREIKEETEPQDIISEDTAVARNPSTPVKVENQNESSNDSSSTFQLPPEFVADDSDHFSPQKLKKLDIQNNSSLEIFENNEIINIDVKKMDTQCDRSEVVDLKTPGKVKKCAFKFSPLDKETLSDENVGMDVESFKNCYLNEVDRHFVNNVPGEHGKKKSRKRKLNSKARIDKKKKRDHKELNKSKVYRKNERQKMKIRFKTRIKLKVCESKDKDLKQYVLSNVNNVVVRPQKEIGPIKRKYNKQEKSSDNLVQTSIQKFFAVKNCKTK